MPTFDVEAIDATIADVFKGAPLDARAREEVVHLAYPLVEYLARRFAGRGEPVEDLIQVASVGLLKTIERFEPEREIRFSTFATPTILGELKRYFRDSGWAIHVPRRLKERALEVRSAAEALTQELGRSPTAREVAGRASMTVEEVLEALEAGAGYAPESLDAPRAPDGIEPAVGFEDAALDLAERWASVAPYLRELDQAEREVLYLRFVKGLTQSQIGREIGYSQMHVSRILRGTLERLRSRTREPDPTR